MSNRSLFFGDGFLHFQLRTYKNFAQRNPVPQYRLDELSKMVRTDIKRTFDSEGMYAGFPRWQPLSPAYAKRRRHEYPQSKGILNRTGKMIGNVLAGSLRFIDIKKTSFGFKIPGSADELMIMAAHITGTGARARAGKKTSFVRGKQIGTRSKQKKSGYIRLSFLDETLGGNAGLPSRNFLRISKDTLNHVQNAIATQLAYAGFESKVMDLGMF
jgi:hypothetical protein